MAGDLRGLILRRGLSGVPDLSELGLGALLARRIVRCACPIQSDPLLQGGERISQEGGGPSIGPWTIISIGYLGMSHGRRPTQITP